ncbi:MAG TPA: hypothetical protein VGL54_04490, partial [Solirubrobacteraceae bacterium]
MSPQSIPDGIDVTVPSPNLETVSVYSVILADPNAAITELVSSRMNVQLPVPAQGDAEPAPPLQPSNVEP